MKMKSESTFNRRLLKDSHKRLRLPEEEVLLNLLRTQLSEKWLKRMQSKRMIKKSWMRMSMKSKECLKNYTRSITLTRNLPSILIIFIIPKLIPMSWIAKLKMKTLQRAVNKPAVMIYSKKHQS